MSDGIKALNAHLYALPDRISQYDLKKFPWIRVYIYSGKTKNLEMVVATQEGLQGFIYIDKDLNPDLNDLNSSSLEDIARKFPKIVLYHKNKLNISGARYVKCLSWADFIMNGHNEFSVELKGKQLVIPKTLDTLPVAPQQVGTISGMSYVATGQFVYIVLRPHCWEHPTKGTIDLGRVVVKIDTRTDRRDDLSFANLHDLFGDANTRVHPHIRENACFGNVADQFCSLLKSKDYTTAGLLLDAFASNVNIDDSWGTEVSSWPKAIGIRRKRRGGHNE